VSIVVTTYCSVGEVDAYANQYKKKVWLCQSEDNRASFVERANRQIHAWHGQAIMWQAGAFNFPCILQAVYIAKNFQAMDLAEIATNASSGSYSDSINSVDAGADVQFDSWAFTMMKNLMNKEQIIIQPRFAHG